MVHQGDELGKSPDQNGKHHGVLILQYYTI